MNSELCSTIRQNKHPMLFVSHFFNPRIIIQFFSPVTLPSGRGTFLFVSRSFMYHCTSPPAPLQCVVIYLRSLHVNIIHVILSSQLLLRRLHLLPPFHLPIRTRKGNENSMPQSFAASACRPNNVIRNLHESISSYRNYMCTAQAKEFFTLWGNKFQPYRNYGVAILNSTYMHM